MLTYSFHDKNYKFPSHLIHQLSTEDLLWTFRISDMTVTLIYKKSISKVRFKGLVRDVNHQSLDNHFMAVNEFILLFTWLFRKPYGFCKKLFKNKLHSKTGKYHIFWILWKTTIQN